MNAKCLVLSLRFQCFNDYEAHLVIFILTFLSWHKDSVTVVSSKSELLSRPCPKLSPSSKRKLRLEEKREGRKEKKGGRKTKVIMITENLFYFF